MLKNVAQILAISAFCLATSAPSSSLAETEVNIEDIDKFGWEYIDEYVSLYAVLEDIHSANHPKNRGRIVATLNYTNGGYSRNVGMFAKGWGRKDINPLLGECIKLSGFVEEVPANFFGNETTVPTLIIDNVGESCAEKLARAIRRELNKNNFSKMTKETASETSTKATSEAEASNSISDALNAPIVNVD